MPEMTSYDPGVPSWVDLGTPDLDAAIRFYGELFGWEAEPSPDPEAGGYTMMQLRGRNVAGIGPLMQEGQPVVWSTYMNVADADATAAAVRDNGGTAIVEPMDVLGYGRFAIFLDPGGAAFGVWQARSMTGAGLVNEPGALCWNELMTRDVDAAKRFYGAVFGWDLETMPFAGTEYTVANVGGRGIAGMMAMGDNFPAEVPPHWGVYFAVDDCDAAVAKAGELGASVMMPPMDVEGVGRMAALVDPHGAPFSVLKLAPQPEG